MRPFSPMSLPELPTFAEFSALVSLHPSSTIGLQDSTASIASTNAQAYSILEVAERAMKIARKEWEAVSKSSAETARCKNCEEWWRAGVKNVLRSCIGADIAIATAKKVVSNAGSVSAADRLKVDIGPSGQSYHPWWIVPKIQARD